MARGYERARSLSPKWDVPLPSALIHSDAYLNAQAELSLRARLPAHIVLSPAALLVTGVTPAMLEQAPFSVGDMLGLIARAFTERAPATIVTYNGLRFDEKVLRHAFFTHLLPPYATQGPVLKGADLLIMLRAVRLLEPEAVTVPIGVNGKPSMKLGDVCRANGIALHEDDAHDAMADTRATLALFRHLREEGPQVRDQTSMKARALPLAGLWSFQGARHGRDATASPRLIPGRTPRSGR